MSRRLKAWLDEAGVMLTPAVAILWLAGVLVLMVFDQLSQLPPPPPTPRQVAAARPSAVSAWRLVYPRLLAALPIEQPRPPELGAVWWTRTGQICGLVDQWHTGVDVMSQFYTVAGGPHFKEEDERRYVRQWSRCVVDPYVVLHAGSLATGACAAKAGAAVCRLRSH